MRTHPGEQSPPSTTRPLATPSALCHVPVPGPGESERLFPLLANSLSPISLSVSRAHEDALVSTPLGGLVERLDLTFLGVNLSLRGPSPSLFTHAGVHPADRQLDAPLFLSHPHFYNADPVLADAVLGLHPNEKEHSLFLDIHPVTGIPMNCSVKLQLSLYIKSIKGIGQTGKIAPVVLPLVWFEERGAMEGNTLQTFYTQLVLMPKVMHYAQYVLLALGGILLLIPVIYQIRSQERCYLFWSSNKKGPKDKEAMQAYSESLMTPAAKGTVLQEARL